MAMMMLGVGVSYCVCRSWLTGSCTSTTVSYTTYMTHMPSWLLLQSSNRAKTLYDDCALMCVYVCVCVCTVFHINTDKITNVRAATHPDEPGVPMARQSIGLVENKLLQVRVQTCL